MYVLMYTYIHICARICAYMCVYISVHKRTPKERTPQEHLLQLTSVSEICPNITIARSGWESGDGWSLVIS